jgi:signal transduction histidine kinase
MVTVESNARDSLEQRVLAEQLALMCKLTAPPLFATMIGGTMFAWLMVEDHGLMAASAWYFALLVAAFIRWRISRAFLAQVDRRTDLDRWRYLMIGSAALGGAIWSLSGSLLLPTDREKEIVMTIMFIGATASGVGSQAPVRHAYAALLIPFVLPYAINQMAMGGERIISGLSMFVYMPVMLAIAYRQTETVERQIRLAIENEALVGELRRERDRANQANLELQAQIEQQRRSAERIESLNRDLESQAVELRRANSDLEGFSYSVSHDLLAPLRAIHGFASMLREDLGDSPRPEPQHYLSRINENIVRMSTLIDDLLAFSKCGRQPLEMTELDMEALARTAAADAISAHELKQQPEIVIESLPRAWGDPHLVLQVWRNLLDNAVKYSSKVNAPRIVVSGRVEDAYTRFEVTDNGIGFDSQYSEALFGAFQRLHRISDYPGSGVGLAIVQRIVTRHDGDVWARSLSQGSTFGFSLPATPRSSTNERGTSEKSSNTAAS